jgi:outer membrane protein
MKLKSALCAAALLSAATVNTAAAMDQGDWLARFGLSYVNPTSNNHEIVSVDSATSFTFNFEYMMTQNWGLELLAAYPFKHDIELIDGTEVASTKHLPPTLSVNYHFAPDSKFQPYLGLGLNYTLFFSEKTYGALEGVDLDLGGSWGLAGDLGADIMLNDKWFLNLSVRYIGIETKAKLDGESIGKVKINPWVYSGNIGFRF